MKISVTISEDFGTRQEVEAFAERLRVLCAELFCADARPSPPLPDAVAVEATPPPVRQVNATSEPAADAKVRVNRRSDVRSERDARRTARRWRYPLPDPSRVTSYDDFRAAVGCLLERSFETTLPLLLNALYRRDVALQLIAERALEPTDKMVRLMTKRCGVALRGQRDRGVATSIEGAGMAVLWIIC